MMGLELITDHQLRKPITLPEIDPPPDKKMRVSVTIPKGHTCNILRDEREDGTVFYIYHLIVEGGVLAVSHMRTPGGKLKMDTGQVNKTHILKQYESKANG